MKRLIAVLSLALAFVAPALVAQTSLKIPADKPVASIQFPEGWSASVEGDMITAGSDEGDALMNVIVTRPDMLGPSNDKAFALLKVKPVFDTYKDTKSTLNGMNVVEVKVDATDGSGKTIKLTLTAVEVTKDKGVMVILRGDAVEKHAEEITGILNSIAAAQ
jgi:hypothetical protein